MIIPRKIIFITIAIAPLALAAAFLPSLTVVLLAVVAVFLIAAVIDFLLCLKYRKKIKVNVPEVSHASQLRDGTIEFFLENVLESKILIENFSHCLHPLFKAGPAPAAFDLLPGSRFQLTVPCTPQRRATTSAWRRWPRRACAEAAAPPPPLAPSGRPWASHARHEP